MESLYTWGVSMIQDIQTRYPDYDNFLETVSRIGDPAYAFSIIFPIISTINTLLAADILMVSVIAEWSNTLLKWLFREDRPYWWVRESNSLRKGYPYLKQGPLTCETGPGSPSGHVMGCAALLYVLITACIRHYSARCKRSGENSKFISTTFWSIYVTILMLVSLSRMYVATHFPHQCVLGAILGFLIGHYFGNAHAKPTAYWHSSTKLKLLAFVLGATVLSFTSYWIQKAFGIDPQWSVKMAFKWCEHVENVHVNTTPLFSLVRDTGLGLGLVSVSPVIQRATDKHNLMVSVACVLAYCTALHLAQVSVPTSDAKIFYMCHALLYSTIPYVLIGILPRVATVNKRKTN
ncbi:Glucose-6-Phosphatase [Carabus blaptoides fortunei]